MTGDTKGIGAMAVRRFVSGGATVLTTARSVPAGDSGHFIQADMKTREGADKVIKATLDRLGGLDVLVNSVGGSTAPGGGVLGLNDEHWREAFDLNLLPAVRLDRGFLPSMLKKASGVIIHVSSIQRTPPLFDATLAYASAKAALTNYSKGLSKEHNLSHLGGITDLFPPIRFQGFGNGSDGGFVVREEFRCVLSRQEGPRERDRRIFLPSHQVASGGVLWRRADFEYSFRDVSAQTARAAGDQPYFVHKFLPFFFALIDLVSDRRSAALNWEGVVPSHVRKAR